MTKQELELLLTVARILRSRISEMAIDYQKDDIDALTEALAPWSSVGESQPTVGEKAA